MTNWRFPIFVVAAAFLGLAAAGRAEAEARRALVIGIDKYESVEPLQKAVGDANAVAEKLRSLGFEVDVALDADRRTLNRAISSFMGKIEPGDTAFVHYSGHGVEIDSENFLLPADIPEPKPGEKEFVKSEAVSLGGLTAQMAGTGAKIRIFVIDACRDNPFSEKATRSIGSLGRGLSRPSTPEGTFILYSAGERQTALDRLGDGDPVETSVFTRVLVSRLGEEGLAISDLAKDVRIEVAALAKGVGHVQTPAVYDEITGRFYLNGEGGTPAAPVATIDSAPAPTPPTGPVAVPEDEAWELARSVGTKEAWEAFIAAYPGTFRANLAKAEIGKIARAERAEAERAEREKQEKEVAVAVPPPATTPAKPVKPARTDPPAAVPSLPDPPPVSSGASFWDHNGSTMYLVASGKERTFAYYEPKRALAPTGIRRGTVVFTGRAEGGSYRGTAYLFSRFCPPVGFEVSGPISNGSKRVSLRGQAPKRDRSCQVTGVEEETLVFDFSHRGSL